MRSNVLVLLALLGACRIQSGKWQGAPPRKTPQVRLALYGNEARARDAVEATWRKDPKLAITIVDPEAVPGGCNAANPKCTISYLAGCHWARDQGFDLYAEAVFGTSSGSTFVQTTCSDEDGFGGKGHESCDGYYKDGLSAANLNVRTYNTADCREVGALSTELGSLETGNSEEARQAATVAVLAKARASLPAFPEQTTLDEHTRITGTTPGFYAIFRGGKYHGTMQVDDIARPGKLLTCCIDPRPDDRLVQRGRIEQLSLDVSLSFTQLRIANEQHFTAGLGAHIRWYKLDGGFEVQLDAEALTAGGELGNAFPMIASVGWGLRPTSWLRISATGGGGALYAQETRMSMSAHAFGPIAWAGVRAIAMPSRIFYIGIEAGALASPDLTWKGDGAAVAEPMAFRGPMFRIFAALSD